MQLLINLWIEEETRLGVTVLEGSVLAHKTNPFYTLAQDSVEPEPVPKPASDPSPSILEVGDNIRAKVYSVFCKMGWDSDARLSSEHKVKLVAIKKYLEFKHGEVMHEIATELVLENTRPVTPDQELLDLAAQVTKKITASVQDEQHRLLHEAHQQGLRTEHDLYESVKAHRKVQTSEEHKFKEFIIRTSNRSALKAAQHKRAEAIRRSRRATSRSTSPSEPRDQACAFPCDSTFTGLSQSGGSSQPSACASNASMKREDYDVHVLADFEDLGLSMSSIAGDDIFSACDESVAIKVPAMPPQPPPPFLPRLANKCS